MAGDFSPLTVDTSSGEPRLAPPAMLIALAVGLGSIDMPIPQVATWEWVSWKFPKPVRAGETIYARWTLTQKRPPVHGARTGIAVWRVDVHTAADGAMCAEGEIGAAIVRRNGAVTTERAETPTGGRRRRRGRRGGAGEATPAPAPQVAAPAPKPAGAAERTPSRRRRRRRSGSSSGSNDEPAAAAPALPAPEPVVSAPEPTAAAPSGRRAANPNPLSRAIRRLRRTP